MLPRACPLATAGVGGVDVVDAGEWSSVLNVVVNVVTVRGRGRGRERGHSPWSWS